ncbi:ParA family protein [Corynebacterium bovis]|uniref:ParA family protein n=2 Tax=Corynebacterium bovis TaxID=36808 RepID=UPI00163B2023|nr:ParA family protein [Corynebacterium bovis]
MIIAVANTKGGVGKTTAAIYLAEAFARRGVEARVIDMDPQGSATRWYDLAVTTAAAEGKQGPRWRVENLTEYRLKQVTDTDTPTVIDCPPGDPRVFAIAADLANMVILPCRPSPDDYARTKITYRSLPEGKGVILVNDARLRTTALEQILDDIDSPANGSDPLPRFDTVVTHREHIVHANGTVPDKLNGYEDVLDEIEEALENA